MSSGKECTLCGNEIKLDESIWLLIVREPGGIILCQRKLPSCPFVLTASGILASLLPALQVPVAVNANIFER